MWSKKGQAIVVYTLSLGAFMGLGALAVDLGNLYWGRAFFQRTADAGALAGASGLLVDQNEATSRAVAIANQNLSTLPSLADSDVAVTFPAADVVRVSISQPAVGLYFGGVIGIPTAPVSATATARLETAAFVPGEIVPLSVYCNNPNGCEGALSVGQTYTSTRYCGNIFVSGPNGSTCGNDPVQPGEVIITGVTFERRNHSNAELRRLVYNGYAEGHRMKEQLFEVAEALPGNRNGFQSGMIDRLSEGRNEMVFTVLEPAEDGRTMKVADFAAVRVQSFRTQGKTDVTTFEIIRRFESLTEFAANGQGVGINSVVGTRLTE